MTRELTWYGRILDATEGLRIAIGLFITAPVWLPLCLLSWLVEHTPDTHREGGQ